MFPNYKNKADRESKRQALLNQYTKDLQDDEAKRQAYAEAMWTSDVEKNKINLLGRNVNTQTDSSSSSIGTQASPSSSSSGTQFTPPSSSSGTQTNSQDTESMIRSIVNDIITNSANDIGNEDDSMSDIESNENMNESMEVDDEAAQFHSRAWVKALFIEHPVRATAGYRVIRNKSDIPDRNYVLSKDAIVYNRVKRKPARRDIVETIDWVETAEYVEQLGIEQGIHVSRAIADMGNEDKGAAYVNHLKRRARTQKRGLIEVKQPRIDDLTDNANGTSNNQTYAREAIRELYNEDRDALDRLGVNAIDFNKKLIPGFTIRLNKDGSSLIIVKNNGKLTHNPSTAKQTSWVYTLDYLRERLGYIQTNVLYPRAWETRADHAVNSGVSTQFDDTNDSKATIERIYSALPWIDTLEIRPIQNYGSRKSDSYYFGDQLQFYTIKKHQKVAGKAREDLIRQINWKLTLHEILQQLSAYREMRQDTTTDTDINLVLSNPDEFNRHIRLIKEIDSVLRQLHVVTSTRRDILNLKGRGLMGAGRADAQAFKPSAQRPLTPPSLGLKGYSGTSKNLRSIQGSGTASDLKYKQLGSKFIRITDLRLAQPKLKLVYANRTQVGRMIEISKPLAKVIETLVFDQNVDQQSYNRLSVNDKQIVHDLLRLCHLETTLRDPPSHPIDQLQAEFDKLRSQVMLGNDNPNNIKELKALSPDLYNIRLINDEEMRSILNLCLCKNIQMTPRWL